MPISDKDRKEHAAGYADYLRSRSAGADPDQAAAHGIEWTRRKRPSKDQRGHDIRRTGYQHLGYFRERFYLECECGKRLSSQASHNAVYYAWERHRRDLGL